MSAPAIRRFCTWVLVVALTAAIGLMLGAISVPSGSLFAALVVAIGIALRYPTHRLRVSHRVVVTAQAVIGCSLGASVDSHAIESIGSRWLVVAVVTTATLMLSLLCGVYVADRCDLDRATGALGLIAGGASAIVSTADELGADARLVAFMQYLRVLGVVSLAPLVVGVVGHAGHQRPNSRWDLISILTVLGCASAGVVAARVIPIPAGALLYPLVIVALLSAVADAPVASPPVLESAAVCVIGWQVGLRFTSSTIRELRRLFLTTIGAVVVLVTACAGLGAVLMPLAHVTFADAYLATTPGGFYAVLATAAMRQGEMSFVVSAQLLRVLVMTLFAPSIIRAVVRRPRSFAGSAQDDAELLSSPSAYGQAYQQR